MMFFVLLLGLKNIINEFFLGSIITIREDHQGLPLTRDLSIKDPTGISEHHIGARPSVR